MSVYFGDRSMTIGVFEPNVLLDLTTPEPSEPWLRQLLVPSTC